ncbi:MAG: energy transducer TonB [Flavobacteriales bacterium]
MTATMSSDRNKSLAGTLLLHCVIVAMLFLVKCNTTGGGGGNDGTGLSGMLSLDAAGIGTFTDGFGYQPMEPESNTSVVAEESTEEAITEETSQEAPVMETNRNNKPESSQPITEQKPKEEPKKVSDNLKNAFDQMKQGSGNTNGTGQQGIQNGSKDGVGLQNGGSSMGQGGGQGGGNGTGTGPGNGSGTGPGNGNLASDYKLDGRNMIRKPKISERAPDEGVVVVDIWVDKNGNVTRATANPGLSRATNAKLYKLAEEAARKAVFSSGTMAEQKGTLKITFRLN